MTPKEKAEELIYKFNTIDAFLIDAKQCALIVVDEVLNTIYSIPFGNALDNELEYWEEVKKEICDL
jgi:hypothetical protein